MQLTFAVMDDYGNMVPAVILSLVSSNSDNSSNGLFQLIGVHPHGGVI